MIHGGRLAVGSRQVHRQRQRQRRRRVERGKWGSHLVGVVETVVHESRDERRLPDCKAERRERFSCKVSLWPGSSKYAHLKGWFIRTTERGETDLRKKTPSQGVQESSRGTHLSDARLSQRSHLFSRSYHPNPGLF